MALNTEEQLGAAIGLLHVAEKALKKIRAELDDTTLPCESCGLNVHLNYDDAQLARGIDATLRRLDKHQAEINGRVRKLVEDEDAGTG